MLAGRQPSMTVGVGLLAALIAGCTSGSDHAVAEGASTASKASTSASPSMSAAPQSSAPTPADAPSAAHAAGAPADVWTGCDASGRGDVVIVLCGPVRFGVRKRLARIDERAVRAELAKLIADTVPGEVPFDVREGQLDDGTPAWFAKARGTVVDRKTSMKSEASFVAYGVKQANGWGDIVMAAAPDERTAARDANALWSAPPEARPFSLPGAGSVGAR